MIKTLTAYTIDVDDESAALKEIIQKLDLQKNRLKNSVALVFRHKYFDSKAFYIKLEQELQMEVITVTTLLSATNMGFGAITLSVLVLTSDTAEFVTGLSKPIDGKPDLAGLYRETAAKAALPPKAVFLFSTPPYPLSGAEQVRILNEASGQLPLFGSVSICLPAKAEDTSLYYNGEFCSDGLALVILCGKFKASFSYLITPIRKHLIKGVLITKAEKNILKELNKTTAAHFLKEAGIIHEAIDGVSLLTMPLCVENSLHSGYIRIMHFINEDGSIYCHSDLEEGKTASVGIIEHRDIIDSALKFFDDIAAKNGSAIIFSCGVRSIALGLNYDSEVSIISEKANSDYLFAYSGGEYCPSPSGDNNFLTACITACRFE